MNRPPDAADNRASAHVPRLAAAEWLIFALLAALLALINVYTTLLLNLGESGSLLAVLASVLLLRAICRHMPPMANVNLGQTMASAGGAVGFSVAMYAAIKLAEPSFAPGWPVLIGLFAAMGVLGTLIATSVRRFMVRYYFPSGTACAVIQKTVSAEAEAGRRARPLRLLALWGTLAAAATIPSKITLHKGGTALLQTLSLGKLGLSVEPLLYGLGLIVGPRLGGGMVLGGLAAMYLVGPRLAAAGIAPERLGDWLIWLAIALTTLPTFANIAFTYAMRAPPSVPAGFTPGRVHHQTPRGRDWFYAGLGIAAAAAIAGIAQAFLGLPIAVTIAVIALAWVLCVVSIRIAADTDFNVIPLLATMLLVALAWAIAGGQVALLGVIVIGGTLSSLATDMMQDYRTGFLVDANPTHQTTVQFVGTVLAALVAVPFLGLLESQIGLGEGTGLPAPGARLFVAMAATFSGEMPLTGVLLQAVIIASVVGCAYAFFTVWGPTARWMPSLFGIAIGLLIPFAMSAAILVGGLSRYLISALYHRRASMMRDAATADVEARTVADVGPEAEPGPIRERAEQDAAMIGTCIFAGSALISVLLIILVTLMSALDLEWFFLSAG